MDDETIIIRDFETQLQAADALVKNLREAVNEQAEDEVLWSVPAFGTQPIVEAHLQQELRRLHEVAESALAAYEKARGK